MIDDFDFRNFSGHTVCHNLIVIHAASIEEFNAIINPYESAILAIGTIMKKPWVIYKENGEEIGIFPIMKITLSVDHRLINGVQAAMFLNSLKNTLENPEQILLL